MLYQLSQLNTEERELIYDAPVWVSIYVALADNRIKKEERKKIVETVHTKTFSEKNDLSEMYKELEVNIESRIQIAIDQIPVFQEDKEPFVREKLVFLVELIFQNNLHLYHK